VGHSLSEQGDPEATHHVPLLFCMPSAYQVEYGELNVLCSSADIAPTVYDLVGMDWVPLAIKSSVGNYGKSLLPYINMAGSTISSNRGSPEGTKDQPISEQDRYKKEGIERLRSLGYVR
jgi:hypothetical protein